MSWTPKRVRGPLLAAVALALAGCSSFQEAPTNEQIMDRLDEQIRKEDALAERSTPRPPVRPEERQPYSIAIAPVSLELTAAGRPQRTAEPDAAEEADGQPSDAGAADEEQALLPAEALPQRQIAVKYRRPLHRHLLFAPRSEPAAGAPALQLEIREATDEGVVYVCPRCQADVSEHDERCSHCLFTLDPDDVLHLCPRCQNDVGRLDERCRHCYLALMPEVEHPEAPPEVDPHEPTPPELLVDTERYICFFCGVDIDHEATECHNCKVSYFDLTQPIPEPGEPVDLLPGDIHFSHDRRRATFSPNPVVFQRELSELVRDYGLFTEVHAMPEFDAAATRQDILDLAAAQNYTYVLLPTVRRAEVAYEGLNWQYYALALPLWVAAWVPAWFVPAEDYSAFIEVELRLAHARTGQEFRRWQTRFEGRHVENVDQIDRGWYPWSALGVPLGVHPNRRSGYRKVHDGTMPIAMAQVKEQLIRQLYESFVEFPAPSFIPTTRRNVAMLVGADRVQDMTAGLSFTDLDIEAMERSFTEVTGWVAPPDDAPRGGDIGEVVRFDPSRDHTYQPTLENVRRFLNIDLQRLEQPDTFVFYFSGYGAVAPVEDTSLPTRRDGYERYLCFADTDPSQLEETALSITELKQALDSARCRNVIVILDTSFAMQLDGMLDATGKTLPGIEVDDELTDEFLEALASRGTGKWGVVFAASAIDGVAVESQFAGQDGMSVLTYAFVSGVEGEADRVVGNQDGTVSILEAATYVREMVRRFGFQSGIELEAPVAGRPQMPVLLKPAQVPTGP